MKNEYVIYYILSVYTKKVFICCNISPLCYVSIVLLCFTSGATAFNLIKI